MLPQVDELPQGGTERARMLCADQLASGCYQPGRAGMRQKILTP